MPPAPNTKRPNGAQGFLLAEVAIALVIFGISASILAQTYRAGHLLRTQAREEGLATAAAQDVLERMRGARFNDVVARFDSDPFNDPGGPGTAHGATLRSSCPSSYTSGGRGRTGRDLGADQSAWRHEFVTRR